MTWLVDETIFSGEHELANSPGWHMSVDQWLLDHWMAGQALDKPPRSGSAECPSVALRLYRWKSPTLSIGYFQNAAERETHDPSKNIALVRRASGGGAIVHDRELTYSLAVTSDQLPRLLSVLDPGYKNLNQNRAQESPNQKLYAAIHRWIIDSLAELGVPVKPFKNTARRRIGGTAKPGGGSAGPEKTWPFLCFQRRTGDDLVINGYKVVGSAQRRSRFGVLQHGSILWQASASAPELPGIANCSETKRGIPDLENCLLERWAEVTQASIRRLEFDPQQVGAIDKICTTRFANQDWNGKR